MAPCFIASPNEPEYGTSIITIAGQQPKLLKLCMIAMLAPMKVAINQLRQGSADQTIP